MPTPHYVRSPFCPPIDLRLPSRSYFCDAVWNHIMVCHFNFAWQDATTFEPYEHESEANLALYKSSGMADHVEYAAYFDVESENIYGHGTIPERSWVLCVVGQQWKVKT